MRSPRLSGLILLLFAPALMAAGPKPKPRPQPLPDVLGRIAGKIRPSLLDVELTLRYDKGEAPRAIGGNDYSNFAQFVADERPYRVPGYLVGAKSVLIDAPLIHPRFVKKIEVTFGGARTSATPAAWFTRGGVMLLKLDDALAGTVPLSFHPDAKGPYFTVSYSAASVRRWVGVHALGSGPVWIGNGKAPFRGIGGLIVDSRGRPVGLPFVQQIPIDGSWKGNPLDREKVTAADMNLELKDLEKRLGSGIVRVELDFRSPRQGSSNGPQFFSSDDSSDATRMDVPGVRFPEGRLLVLASLSPKTTARLQKITVHPATGAAYPAEFAGTLKYFGAFLAKVPDLPGAVVADNEGPVAHEEELLLAVRVLFEGETRICRSQPAVYSSVQYGWREELRPNISGQGLFLFSRDGRLVALPLPRRNDQSNRYGSGRSSMFAASYLAGILADPKEQLDPSNVPLKEQEENRVAWLGVVLQSLNRDLARANNVSDLTRDGSTGALVSYVYAGSPAAKAGIHPGAILVRLYSPDRPAPLEVTGSGLGGFPFGMGNMPPGIREQFFASSGGTPWPSVDNPFTRMLTSLGFGSKFDAEYVQDGKVIRKKFTVVASPPHYDTVPRWKSEALGLTVRNLSFEVRRYYRFGAKQPGVIVSKVEPGDRAAVAGIMPFEIVTQVDDQPVNSVAEFRKLTKAPGEHRFFLRRKAQSHIVTITVPRSKSPTAGHGSAGR